MDSTTKENEATVLYTKEVGPLEMNTLRISRRLAQVTGVECEEGIQGLHGRMEAG